MTSTLNINWFNVIRSLSDDVGLDAYSLNYVLRRFNNEGVRFLTETLPQLAKSVLNSLEKGYFCRPDCFAHKGASLRYFRRWLDKIFARDGSVLPTVCSASLRSLRLFSEYFYKLNYPLKEEVYADKEIEIISMERSSSLKRVNSTFLNKVRRAFVNLYPKFTEYTVSNVFSCSRPRDGKGSFAFSSRLKRPYYLYKKYSDHRVGSHASEYNAFSGYFRPYPSCKQRLAEVQVDRVSETLYVPKDSRGPRPISKEPMHHLRAQMAYFDFISSKLERLSNGRINFSDQEVNRELAREASVSRRNATIDLKDASDRVSYKVVRYVFRESPFMRWFFDNARSTHTVMQRSGVKIPLSKLSGMGSGLTFPTMALLVQCSIVAAVVDRYPSYSYKEIADQVYVYGDDIVVPSRYYHIARKGLTSVGLLVNENKSYVRSYFRESCGGDYYNGVDVAPARLKLSSLSENSDTKFWRFGIVTSDQAVLLQLERHCRELTRKGLLTTRAYYYKLLSVYFGKYWGPVSSESSCLGEWSEEPLALENLQVHRVVPATTRIKSTLLCPYRHLSRVFNVQDDDQRNRLAYGYADVPYQVKLVRRCVQGITLR